MKRFITVLLILTLTLSVFMLPASAATPNTPTNYSSEETRTPTYAELSRLYRMVDAANAAIKLAVKFAQLTPYNDIDALQKTVACITAPVFLYGDLIGAEVLCEYTAYEIDGQTVLVDPLRVVNIKPPVNVLG